MNDPCPICQHDYAHHKVSSKAIDCWECPTEFFCFTMRPNGRQESASQTQPPSGKLAAPDDIRKRQLLAAAQADNFASLAALNATNRKRLQVHVSGAVSSERQDPADEPCDLCHATEAYVVMSNHGRSYLCDPCRTTSDDVELALAARMRSFREQPKEAAS